MFSDRPDPIPEFTDPSKMTEEQLRAWIAWLEPIAKAEPLTIETTAEHGPV